MKQIPMQWQKHRKKLGLASVTAIAVALAGFNIPKIQKGTNQLITGQHFNVGVVAVLDSEYETAIDKLTQVLNRDPNFTVAYKKRGLAYLETGEYKLALQDYQKAVKNQETDTDLFLQIGRTYLNLKNHSEAARLYTKAIDNNPQLSDAYVGRGIAYYKQQKYWDALEELNQALNINQKSVQAFLGRGLVYAKLSGSEKAIENYEQALILANNELEPESELEPDSKIAHLSLGMARYNKNDKSGALLELKKSIEIDSEFTEAYALKSIIHIEQEQYELALKTIERTLKSLEANKSGIGLTLNLDESTQLPIVENVYEGFSAEQQGIQAQDRILAIDGQPVDSMPISETVERFYGPDETTTTVQIQREGKENFEVRLVRNFSLTQHQLALILAIRALANINFQNTEQALADCQRAEEINLRNGFAYQLCGAVYQTNGNLEAAKASYQLALELFTTEKNEDGINQAKSLLQRLEKATSN
ncbi:MAG: tetratricopeptide repeat protein [Leptolyngbya sp. SIO3F4]|nr:tetratricopeptide repeat protein [Leptolyngbya sp. SIO3F4]